MKLVKRPKAIRNMLLSHTPEVYEEKNRIYVDELIGFIDNPRTNNIALMGDYGTGKSSILEQLKDKLKQHKYRWRRRDAIKTVSFLSFRVDDSKNESESENKASHADVELNKDDSGSNNPKSPGGRSLRASIQSEFVRQLFYSVSPNKLRGSHYSRVGRTSPVSLKVLVIAVYAVILMHISGDILGYIHTCIDMMLAFVMTMLMYVIAYMVIISIADYLCEHPPKLLGVSGVEVALKDNDNDFEQLLDEIIYFFIRTKCRLLIIEDIDRFNNVEIYEDLRDLNIMLNSSRKPKKKITFVYAMRPSLLLDISDRAKLFDITIPVMPFMFSETVEEYLGPMLSSVKWRDTPAFTDDDIKNVASIVAHRTVDARAIRSIANDIYVSIERFSNSDNWDGYKPIYIAMFSIIRELYPSLYSSLLISGINVLDRVYEQCASIKREKYKIAEKDCVDKQNIDTVTRKAARAMIKSLRDRYGDQQNGLYVVLQDGKRRELSYDECGDEVLNELLSVGHIALQVLRGGYPRESKNVELADIQNSVPEVARLLKLGEYDLEHYKEIANDIHKSKTWSYFDEAVDKLDGGELKNCVWNSDFNSVAELLTEACRRNMLCDEYRMYVAPVRVGNSNARVCEFAVRFLNSELPSYASYELDEGDVIRILDMSDSRTKMSEAMFNFSIFKYLLAEPSGDIIGRLVKKYARSLEFANFLIGYVDHEYKSDIDEIDQFANNESILKADNDVIRLAGLIAKILTGDSDVAVMVNNLKEISDHKFWLVVFIAYINIAKDESYAAIGGVIRDLTESEIVAISNNNLGNKLANLQKSIGMKTRQLSSFLLKSDIDKIVELWNFELSKENLDFVKPGVLTNVLATGTVSTDDMKFILLNGSGSQKNVVLARVLAIWNANQNALDGELAHCAVNVLRDDVYQGMNPAFIASLLEQHASADDAQIILPKYIDSLDDSDVLRAIKETQYQAVLDTDAPYVRIQACDGWRSVLDKLKAMGYINRYEDMGNGKIHVVPTKHKNEV